MNAIDPKKVEEQKTAEQRAEDIAYTINHSLACTTTDLILNPLISAATEGMIKRIGGCGHDHSKDSHGHTDHHDHHEHGPNCNHGHHDHSHHDHAHEDKRSFGEKWDALKKNAFTAEWWKNIGQALKGSVTRERLKEWFKSEVIGDFGAVIPTIALQRYAPSFMHGVRQLLEPVLKPLFAIGAERATKKWANENGIEKDSNEYKTHKAAVLEHEMSHLPQAAVWTAISMAISIAVNWHGDKSADKKLSSKVYAALTGNTITAGLVVAARAFAPGTVRSWDQAVSGSVITPTTKFIGKAFGVTESDVDRMVRRDTELNQGFATKLNRTPEASWTQRAGETTTSEIGVA